MCPRQVVNFPEELPNLIFGGRGSDESVERPGLLKPNAHP